MRFKFTANDPYGLVADWNMFVRLCPYRGMVEERIALFYFKQKPPTEAVFYWAS